MNPKAACDWYCRWQYCLYNMQIDFIFPALCTFFQAIQAWTRGREARYYRPAGVLFYCVAVHVLPCLEACILAYGRQWTVKDVEASQGRKEGSKYYICSSRLGLIRWDIIQHVKAVHHKVSNTSDVQLPHELLHCASTIGKQCSILITHSLQSRALKDHVATRDDCYTVRPPACDLAC